MDWSDGVPRSRRFDDVYYTAHDGLAESRAVFLQGCGLPQAWACRRRFVVGELGFGTGLNILALLALWRDTREPSARLHVFSVEAYPLTRAEAERALAAWPELAELAAPLLRAWPDGRQGFHRIDFPEHGALLDLWIGEAEDGLVAWSGHADAWLLDGFAPAKNPQMWSDTLLQHVGHHCAPGARLATFTVAGSVRRSLTQAGFSIGKRPGYGRKRERLEARRPEAGRLGDAESPKVSPPRIAIVGAGIAGAALARALGQLGYASSVIDSGGPGAGASGNPAALVTPRLDAGLGPVAQLHAQAFARAVALYGGGSPDGVIARGALQLETGTKDAGRFATIAAWRGFAAGALAPVTAEAVRGLLREGEAPGALAYRDALVVEPARVLQTWLGETPIIQADVAALHRTDQGWALLDAAGTSVMDADAVVLAAGPATVRLLPPSGFAKPPLHPVRGQASWTSAVTAPGPAAAWGGYAIPLSGGGLLFGATHGRGEWDVAVRTDDDARNLAQLAHGRPALASAVEASRAVTPLRNRASLRAATLDHMPLAGAVPGYDGLFVLSGLGGRGFTLAPLLAEHVSALIAGAPSPLACTTVAVVDPGRFAEDREPERRSRR